MNDFLISLQQRSEGRLFVYEFFGLVAFLWVIYNWGFTFK